MKRYFRPLAAGFLCLSLLLPRAALAAGGGDMDGSGAITAADAAALLRVAAGNGEADAALADVTGNLSITKTDAAALLMLVTGKLDALSDLNGLLGDTLLGEDALDKFSYTGTLVGERSYRSDKVSVTITEKEFVGSVCYVADIYIRSIDSLRTAFSSGEYRGQRQYALKIAAANNAIVATTGDMYTMNAKGAIVRNGVWYNDTKVTEKRDICVIYRDGTMATFEMGTADLETIRASGDVYQMWIFGPILLDAQGQPKTKFNCSTSILGTNPRSVLGYYAPGHYCLVVVDGRQRPYSVGLTMEDLSQFMYELGCTAAYNLDGGKSATLVDSQKIISKPATGGRTTTDIVYIGEPAAAAAAAAE